MKLKRIIPLLLSAIMTVGTATAVPFTASAVETNAPVVSAQSAKTSLATPKISKAESINGGVKISWGKVNGAEKYRIYYKGSKGWTRLADTTSTSYTDSKVSSGKTYTYTVRCINSSATKFTSGYDSKGKTVKYISAQKPKKKVWVDDYKTVHHEGYWKVVGTHEEPVYGWVGYNVCNDCGMKMKDAKEEKQHLLWELDNGGSGSYHYEEEYVQTGTKTVEDKEWVKPWDEKVVVGGHYEYR